MQGENDKALAAYLRAVELLEADRRNLTDEQSRGTFLENKIEMYYRPVLQLLERRRTATRSSCSSAPPVAGARRSDGEPADRAVEPARAGLRGGGDPAQPDRGPPDRSCSSSGTSPTATATPTGSRASRPTSAGSRASIAPWWAGSASEEPHGCRPSSCPSRRSLAQVQESARRDGHEVLYYLVRDTGMVVWLIGADSVTVRSVFLPRSQLSTKVDRLRKSLTDGKAAFDVADLARALSLPRRADAAADEDRSPRDRAARGSPLPPLPGPAESRGRQLPWRARAALVRAERHRAASAPRRSATSRAAPSWRSPTPISPRRWTRSTRSASSTLAAARSSPTCSRARPTCGRGPGSTRWSTSPSTASSARGRPSSPTSSSDATPRTTASLPRPRCSGSRSTASRCSCSAPARPGGRRRLTPTRSSGWCGAALRGSQHAGAVLVEGGCRLYCTLDDDVLSGGAGKPLSEAARLALRAVKQHRDYAHPYHWAAFSLIGR